MAKKDVELLPEDTDNNDEVELGELRVDFSSEEASSEALDFSPVPTGKYNVRITGVENKKSTSEKNPGKPYWALTLTIQDGPHEGRKLWANVMLWAGAAYSLAQLMKATGHEDVVTEGSANYGKIPAGSTLIGEELVVSVVKMKDAYKMKEAGDGEVIFKNEVKGYKPAGALAGGSSSGNSLLPG
jgi:hypothetical protein